MNLENYPYNPLVERIVKIMMCKTQNYDPHFFRTQTNFFLTLVPSNLNVKIKCELTGTIPVNMYAISLMPSGSGKGFSTHILEHDILSGFIEEFTRNIFPKKAELSLELEASRRSANSGLPLNEVTSALHKEFKMYGSYVFFFDSATAPAVKQVRNKLLLAKSGALNLITDEIGLNLSNNTEVLTTLLELFDCSGGR